MKDGVTRHCSHIFSYNWAARFQGDSMRALAAKLNLTEFKILAWSLNEELTLI